MDEPEQVYRDLQRHMDSLPVGYPATQSGVEIRLLKYFFTPEEAEVATYLSITPQPIERIYERVKGTGMPLERLQALLDAMERRVSVETSTRGGKKHYRNQVFVVGLYEALVNRLTPEFLQDMQQYFKEGFGRGTSGVKTPQMRVIPVEKSIPLPEKYDVATYDSVRRIMESNTGQFAVANCICRQAQDLAGDPCKFTDLRELCLILEGGQYIQAGLGRAITREEAFAVLEKAREAGLVLRPINAQRPSAICCCCSDCCGGMKGLKRMPHPSEFVISNFYAEIDPELCTGCQTCIDHCQLGAPFMKNGVAAVNLDRCIGCGNCVTVCPAEAVKLNKKQKETVPPEDSEALYQQIGLEKARS